MVQRLLASLACCSLLALAGCSDDSSSSAGPDPTPTAKSTESFTLADGNPGSGDA